MKTLTIAASETSPMILFDPLTGELLFEGRLIPENPTEFFSSITEWIISYAAKPVQQTSVVIALEYINTGALKGLLSVLKMLEKINKEDSRVQLIWKTENDNEYMIEIGQDLEAVLNIPVRFIHSSAN